MAGFCRKCGEPLNDANACPNHHSQHQSSPRPDSAEITAMPFPKANTVRRLIGSGIEYAAYTAALAALTLLSLITAGFMDMFFIPLLLLMIGLRDANAGLFSLAKRIGKMRVVEHGSGAPATNKQAVLRNSYYLALTFLMFFPIVLTDIAASMLFVLLVVVDVFMIFASSEGRRIGDLVANTQVVREAD